MIKHVSLFSGIESFKKAMTNLGIENELVGFSEFDKYASTALAAIHGVDESLNFGDITKIDETKVPDCDLITYGFPCQDISVAGLGKGIIEGETRSGLLFDALRIIKHKMPKYAIAENVKNLIGKKFKDDFNSLLEELDSYGYNNYWKVLNSKDYGIPQNRERVFVISIRKDVDDGKFEFLSPFDNGLRLKDLLEDEVEDKYYIDNDRTSILLNNLKDKESLLLDVSQMGREGNPREYTDYAPTLSARDYKDPRLVNRNPNNKDKEMLSPMIVANRGRNPNNPSETTVQKDNLVLEPSNELKLFTNLRGGKWDKIHESARRVYDEEGIAPTIPTCGGGNIEPKVQTNYRIRKLTPKECWRLMGFADEDYLKAKAALEDKFYNSKDRSNSQMYKMAGNSIVVDVLEGILRNLLN